MRFVTPLSNLSWAVLALVPMGIIALYFLKLRRRPVQVPSTLLWRRSLEDLHVNSLFQRLRRNLLLFLQLLVVGLAMLALTGPRLRGSAAVGQRHILVVDNSASMSSTDVEPSRLEMAKEQALKQIDGMASGDLAMIVAFSDRARVVSNYTSNRAVLRERLKGIRPSEGTTNLREALEVASGLANPASDLEARALPEGVIATKAMIPPRLLLYSDGGFPDVEGFSLGNLEPEVVVIGPEPPPYQPPYQTEKDKESNPESTRVIVASPTSDNVALLALQVSRNEERLGQVQVFGRARNYRDEAVKTRVRLLSHETAGNRSEGKLIDALDLEIPAYQEKSFDFDLAELGAPLFEAVLEVEDALALDNRAFAVNQEERLARVLVVTEGNRYLSDGLSTPAVAEIAVVETATPTEAAADPLRRRLAAGEFDLVVYDAVRPEAAPEANTLIFGAMPPGESFEKTRPLEAPVILDWDVSHPLLRYIRDLSLVRVNKAVTLDLPAGCRALIRGGGGPLAFVAPRRGFVDAVVTFPLLTGKTFNTDWPIRSYSFPLFLFNAVRELGGTGESGAGRLNRPGQPVPLRGDPLTDRLEVIGPDGRETAVNRNSLGAFVFTGAGRTGLYQARWNQDRSEPFAVNLFDPRESDIAPRGLVPSGVPAAEADKYKIKIGYSAVPGARRTAPALRNWWKPLALLTLCALLVEWYIYNRRVYV